MNEDTPQDQPKRDSREFDPEVLFKHEAWWRDRQPWLQEKGYMLRPRYRPGWIPSWKGSKKSSMDFEDSHVFLTSQLLDATRMSDGKLIGLKKVSKSIHPFEATIGQLLSSEPLSSDPDNHCVPIYDVLQVPDLDDYIIIVMPFLRDFADPNFETIGEVVDFFGQALRGMRFMHKHHVAHRDANRMNLMLDATPMYPKSFHPYFQGRRPDFKGSAKYYARTQRPPKYYWIDFGISTRYESTSSRSLEYRLWGGDHSVPEFQGNEGPHDPFPTDVYYVGNLIKLYFTEAMYGLEFMESLVADMTQDDPTMRPTMDVVVSRFDEILRSLSTWKLRSRAVKKKEDAALRLYHGTIHAFKFVVYVLKRTSPIPST